jgi:hypothetical protein
VADFNLTQRLPASLDFDLAKAGASGPVFDLRDPLPASLDFWFGTAPSAPGPREGELLALIRSVFSGLGRVGVSGTLGTAVDQVLLAEAQTGAQGPFSGSVSGVAAAMEGAWDPNTFRGPAAAPASVFQDGVRKSAKDRGVVWEYGNRARPQAEERWQDGTPTSGLTTVPHVILVRARPHADLQWASGTHADTQRSLGYVMAWRRKSRRGVSWSAGEAAQRQTASAYVMGWRRRLDRALRHQEGVAVGICRINPMVMLCKRPAGPPQWWIPWEIAGKAPWVWPPPAPPEQPEPESFIPNLDFDLGCVLPSPIWTGADFFLDIETCDRVRSHGWLPPVAPRVIIVIHTLSIVTLPDGTPIPCDEVRVVTDLDSWAWRWSVSVIGHDVANLVHDAKEVELQVDDHKWRGIAEAYDSRRQYGVMTTSVSGRSLSAYLADPWSEARVRVEDTQRTAQQIAEDEVYNTGWSLDWSTVDWMVPAGAFAYDAQTPIGAIRMIAEAVGAVLQTHPWDKVLYVAPRYSVPSWEIELATPDVEIPEGIVISMSTRLQPGTLYRGVWVSGRTQGVAVRVYRSGTDGAPYATMVVDPLITHVDAGRERGKQILAAGGRRAHVTLTMPLLPDIGVVTPGSIVAVGSGAARWKGYVMAVSISARRARVVQTLTIDRPLETP